jgi:hypothetical protein
MRCCKQNSPLQTYYCAATSISWPPLLLSGASQLHIRPGVPVSPLSSPAGCATCARRCSVHWGAAAGGAPAVGGACAGGEGGVAAESHTQWGPAGHSFAGAVAGQWVALAGLLFA